MDKLPDNGKTPRESPAGVFFYVFHKKTRFFESSMEYLPKI